METKNQRNQRCMGLEICRGEFSRFNAREIFKKTAKRQDIREFLVIKMDLTYKETNVSEDTRDARKEMTRVKPQTARRNRSA